MQHNAMTPSGMSMGQYQGQGFQMASAMQNYSTYQMQQYQQYAQQLQQQIQQYATAYNELNAAYQQTAQYAQYYAQFEPYYEYAKQQDSFIDQVQVAYEELAANNALLEEDLKKVTTALERQRRRSKSYREKLKQNAVAPRNATAPADMALLKVRKLRGRGTRPDTYQKMDNRAGSTNPNQWVTISESEFLTLFRQKHGTTPQERSYSRRGRTTRRR